MSRFIKWVKVDYKEKGNDFKKLKIFNIFLKMNETLWKCFEQSNNKFFQKTRNRNIILVGEIF